MLRQALPLTRLVRRYDLFLFALMLQCMSPGMALNCRAGRSQPRQLLGVKQPRLWLGCAAANDPKRT